MTEKRGAACTTPLTERAKTHGRARRPPTKSDNDLSKLLHTSQRGFRSPRGVAPLRVSSVSWAWGIMTKQRDLESEAQWKWFSLGNCDVSREAFLGSCGWESIGFFCTLMQLFLFHSPIHKLTCKFCEQTLVLSFSNMKRAAEMSGRTSEKLQLGMSTFPNSIEVIAFATDAKADWIKLLKQMANSNKAVNHCCRTWENRDVLPDTQSGECSWLIKKFSHQRKKFRVCRKPRPLKGWSWRRGNVEELSIQMREHRTQKLDNVLGYSFVIM